MGSEVLSQQGLDQLQSDGGEVPLPHGRDSLAQVLGLVRAHRVDGGEDEAGGGRGAVGAQQAARVSLGGRDVVQLPLHRGGGGGGGGTARQLVV